MLTVAKVTRGQAAGYAEYLEGKAQAPELGDYYLKDGERVEAPGRWAAGAQAVGCDPETPVRGDVLRELMAARRPGTGEPLRRVGGSGEAVAAIDATFSAPKSVSAVWALADPELREQVERAHETAIDWALSYAVERVAMIRQRVDQHTVIHAKAVGLIATSWRHTTARTVDGRLPDPQLHSHVLLHAAVRRDGRVMAIDSRSWLVHRREVGAAYRTELARELTRLGFHIDRSTGRGGRYFEISGVPGGLIDRWSSRREQVQAAITSRLRERQAELAGLVAGGGPDRGNAAARLELLVKYGQLAPKEERWMSTLTRSGKTLATHRDLDVHWGRTGRELGLDRDGIDQLRLPAATWLPAPSRERLLDALTEFDATFPARDARAVALEQSAGLPINDALAALTGLRDSGDLLRLKDGTATTREHRRREIETVTLARRLAADTTLPLAAAHVAEHADRLDAELRQHGGRLSEEQRSAMILACGERRLVVIEGQAGTGKSTTLTAIARAHRNTGREIIVTSTAALAAQRLARELAEAGVQTSAYSTAALHAAIHTGQVTLEPETTLIHDEAALASTREQRQLLQAVEQSGARLIEVGDPRQNPAVGAGGLWPHLETAARHGGAHARLTINQRARDRADQRDQARFRSGEHETAVRGYAARDRVHFASDLTRAEDLALDAAQADRQIGSGTVVIAQTSNEHLDVLNARAQAIRHQNHELGAAAIPAPGRPYHLHAGDQIQIRRTVHHPEHGPLRNGTTAQITRVDPAAQTIDLALPDGDPLTIDRKQLDRVQLRLAYVQHPFPAQGQTTDTTHFIVSEHATREGSYVALTRAKQQTHLYAAEPLDQDADRLRAVAERISRTEPELPSIHTPLAHEHAITRHPDHQAEQSPTAEQDDPAIPRRAAQQTNGVDRHAPREANDLNPTEPVRDADALIASDKLPDVDDALKPEQAVKEESRARNARRWPHPARPDLAERDGAQIELDEPGQHRSRGWEP